MELKPYERKNAETILSWCSNERDFYKWTAGVMGAYPLTPEGFRFVEKLMPFCAYEGDELVGFFTLRYPDDDREEIRFGFVIVDPAKRGMGYGKEMLRLGIDYVSRLAGIKRATLRVFADNLPAYHCYLAAGFRDCDPKVEETYQILGEAWKCIELQIVKEGLG